MPPLDITRFRLDPPPQTKRGDAAAWRAALENANAQLEHQLNRIANLELLLKFGPNTWRAQSQLSAAAGKQVEAQLTDMRKQIDALNRERKVQQMAAGMELRRLEDEWANAVRKNLEICMACEKLEGEVRMLHEQLPEEERQRLTGEAAAAAAAAAAAGEQQQDGGGGSGEGGGGGGGSNGMANGQHGDGPEPMDE